jgi:hypothetical protein
MPNRLSPAKATQVVGLVLDAIQHVVQLTSIEVLATTTRWNEVKEVPESEIASPRGLPFLLSIESNVKKYIYIYVLKDKECGCR